MANASKTQSTGKATEKDQPTKWGKGNPAEVGPHRTDTEYIDGPKHELWEKYKANYIATIGVSLIEFCVLHNINAVAARKNKWNAARKSARALPKRDRPRARAINPSDPTPPAPVVADESNIDDGFDNLSTAGQVLAITKGFLGRLHKEGKGIDIDKISAVTARLVEITRSLEASSADQAAGAAVAAYKAKSAPLIAGALARIVAAEFVAGQAERTGVAVDAVRDLMDAALDEIEAGLVAVTGKE